MMLFKMNLHNGATRKTKPAQWCNFKNKLAPRVIWKNTLAPGCN